MTQDQIMKLVDAYAMAQYNQAFCDRYDEERRSAARAAVVAAIEVQVQEIARIRELWEADQIESSEQRTQIHQLRAQVETLTKYVPALGLLRNLQPNTQEPVAYLMQPTELSHQSLMKSLHFNKAHARSDWEIIPLYTHPAPQAKPLTDERIIEIAQSTQSAEPGRDGYILPISFARAIEAAHNIVNPK